MGQLGIHHDSLVTEKLLSRSQPESRLKLATGYFNLTDAYMKTITNACPADCSILMAHPNVSKFINLYFLYKYSVHLFMYINVYFFAKK